MRVEYLEIADDSDMQPVERIAGPVRVAAAVWVGGTRLIDNLPCSGPPGIAPEGPDSPLSCHSPGKTRHSVLIATELRKTVLQPRIKWVFCLIDANDLQANIVTHALASSPC